MPNYRRAFVAGGCWFFTVNLRERGTSLLTDNIDALREATRHTMRRHLFRVDAFVVLSDHLHAIWTLPPDDADFSMRWRLIKRDLRGRYLAARGERGIWQRRFLEHLIRDERDYRHHVEYCAINPVKHGLVRRVPDRPHSSFHRDVRAGIFAED